LLQILLRTKIVSHIRYVRFERLQRTIKSRFYSLPLYRARRSILSASKRFLCFLRYRIFETVSVTERDALYAFW